MILVLRPGRGACDTRRGPLPAGAGREATEASAAPRSSPRRDGHRAGTDELEQVGVAALEAAVHDADRLPPHKCRPAVTGLTGRRKRDDVLELDAQPRGTTTGWARPGHGDRTRGRPVTVDDYRVYGTAH